LDGLANEERVAYCHKAVELCGSQSHAQSGVLSRELKVAEAVDPYPRANKTDSVGT